MAIYGRGGIFSSPLDANYFLNAVRYVELNPVRAGIVAKLRNTLVKRSDSLRF